MRSLVLCVTALALSGCGDLFGPDSPGLRVSVTKSVVQPTLEIVMGGDYAIYRTRTVIDVEVTNLGASTITLPTCGLGNVLPSLTLERADGSPSRLQPREVCAGGADQTVAAGETLRLSLERRADLFCGAYSDCPMTDPGTWGHHRLRLWIEEEESVLSNSFGIQSPLVY
jgi:hypothetical protein